MGTFLDPKMLLQQVRDGEVRPHGEESVEPLHAPLQLLHQQVPLRQGIREPTWGTCSEVSPMKPYML